MPGMVRIADVSPRDGPGRLSPACWRSALPSIAVALGKPRQASIHPIPVLEEDQIMGLLPIRPAPAWMRATLAIAAAYNILWGAWVVLFPLSIFRLADLAEPRYPAIWQCVGMIVGVFGVGYAIAALDPVRHWPIVLVGLLGKIFGPIGFLLTASRDELPWSFAWTILTNDLVWWIPFFLILRHAYRSGQMPVPTNGRLNAPRPIASAMGSATDQHGISLLELSRSRPRMVIFLRHLGCTFCREALADIHRQRDAIERRGLSPVLVHMGLEDDARSLFARYKVDDLPRVSDPGQALYRAFELDRGGIGQLFGWREFVRGIAATLRGHRVGRLKGDGLQMPGVFIVASGRIVGAYRHAHASDRPDYARMACDLDPIRSAGAA